MLQAFHQEGPQPPPYGDPRLRASTYSRLFINNYVTSVGPENKASFLGSPPATSRERTAGKEAPPEAAPIQALQTALSVAPQPGPALCIYLPPLYQHLLSSIALRPAPLDQGLPPREEASHPPPGPPLTVRLPL